MELDDLVYTFDPADLGAGSLLGNRDVEAQFDATSNLVDAWSALDDLFFCGPIRFGFTALRQARGDIVPEPLDPLVTRFFPDRQETIFGTEGLILSLRAFVPIATGYERAVGWLVEVQAEGPQLLEVEIDLRFVAEGHGPGQERLVRIHQDRGQVVGTSEPVSLQRYNLTLGSREEVRLFGSPSGPPHQVTLSTPARARLTYRLLVEGITAVPFVLSYSPAGEQVAWSGFLALSDLERFAERSRSGLEKRLSAPLVLTPEPEINRALLWAGAAGLRVFHAFTAGAAVPAAPGISDVDVGAAAWYSMAADWFDPALSVELLETLATKAQTEGGALASVLRGHSEGQETFGLTLSDATPLFVLAVAHHVAVTNDDDIAVRLWPAVKRAAEALLAARSEDGLIRVQPQGTGQWGLPGWRKAIPGYRLEGAITELNVLAAWALFAGYRLAVQAGEVASGERWRQAAAVIAAALPRLARPGGELSRLADGEDDLTGDLVFPLLAGLADEGLAARLALRLRSAFQWTAAGARTVGSDQPGYDPAFAGGLLGGVSPVLTSWVAVAAREHYPELPGEALRALAKVSEAEQPGQRGLVPGQLPGGLHGETFGRLGPELHPLAAPLLRWLAIEGLLGVRLPLVPWIEAAELRPSLPSEWRWLVVSRLPWKGAHVSAIVTDGVIHTDADFEGARVERWTSIEPLPVSPVPAWLLRRGDEQRLFAVTPEQAFDGLIPAGARRWAVSLAAGEAALLTESE